MIKEDGCNIIAAIFFMYLVNAYQYIHFTYLQVLSTITRYKFKYGLLMNKLLYF